jgi:probable F420-dependent oxidoreductase
MRLGFALPQIGPWAGAEALTRAATAAEQLGYDSLWVLERTLVPVEPRVPYVGGRPLPDALRTVLDPLECLSFVAALTSRVTLGTSVLNLPWYNPVLLARRLTTIDVLSNGRLVLGLGIGWAPEEYEAAGVPFEGRGKRFDEALAALKAIWTQNPVELDGRLYSIPRSWIGPKPVQKPHPPILVAGFTPAALERVAHLGDGWHPANVPPAKMAEMFGEIRALAAKAGRDPAKLTLVVRANSRVHDGGLGDDRPTFSGSVDQIADDVVACRQAGASELLFDVGTDPQVGSVEDVLDRLERLYDASRRALAERV